MQFVLGSGLDQGLATLHVVETNPFKHLTHLSLKFLPGSDAEVKKYLASCLKNLQVHVYIYKIINDMEVLIAKEILVKVQYLMTRS